MTSVCRQCPIWGQECPDKIYWGHRPDRCRAGDEKLCSGRSSSSVLVCKCLRAGGEFKVAGPSPESRLRAMISGLGRDAKVRLCSRIARENLVHGNIPVVEQDTVDMVKVERPPTMLTRLDLALEWLVRNSDGRFGVNPFTEPQRLIILNEKVHAFMAFSHGQVDDEETMQGEFLFLLEGLGEKIKMLPGAKGKEHVFYSVSVTAKGYARYEELRGKSVDSSLAFVAMWFGGKTAEDKKAMNEVYDEAIAPAIRDAGYEPTRIDREHHIGKIDDEIIAKIRRARFVVADFTAAEPDKPRGGVYYEAGFAYGLGREVVYTCREDYVDALHFDTRQFNHLTWRADKLAEFRKALRDRIERAIGQGPKPPDATPKAGTDS